MHKKLMTLAHSPLNPTVYLHCYLLSRAPSTTFQGPGTHILHWGRQAKEIPAAVGYGRGTKSNSGRPSPLAPTHKRLPAAWALSRLHGRMWVCMGVGTRETGRNHAYTRLSYAQKIPLRWEVGRGHKRLLPARTPRSLQA